MLELSEHEQHEEIAAELHAVLAHGFPPTFYRRIGKRILDLALGVPLLLLAAPFIGIAWASIRLTSPGPGFFYQDRVGRHGRLFPCYKLRSMYVDQDRLIDMDAVQRSEAEGILVKMEDDPRVTRIGQMIRKGSIDELPQLWNVVRGDMSLVGPRPLVPYMVAPYPDLNTLRCLVKPGITGEWQVKARDDNSTLSGMVMHDFRYIENCNFRNDLSLLLMTIPVVLSTKGAL